MTLLATEASQQGWQTEQRPRAGRGVSQRDE